jgi:hypothetical protein
VKKVRFLLSFPYPLGVYAVAKEVRRRCLRRISNFKFVLEISSITIARGGECMTDEAMGQRVFGLSLGRLASESHVKN